MIIKEELLEDIKIVLSKNKGDGKNTSFTYYIYLVNKDTTIYRVRKNAVIIWKYTLNVSDKKTLEETEALALDVFTQKTDKLLEVIYE
ncbi:hypothetical protein LLS47_24080 [Rouxiella badensis]|uniref:hypothetical protein n=1 Tax=Rouxiella badensis TaxID=1646377 RepID=UPI001D157CFA|nr:hypothetical protein [Rouxiella badensis]MCC3735976.1 hypothetical protein [Rouxiella badensis]MCC3761373.1 hypothetical protein [Rouxiella badensis]